MADVIEQVRDLAERERALGRSGEAYDQLATYVSRLESDRVVARATLARAVLYVSDARMCAEIHGVLDKLNGQP